MPRPRTRTTPESDFRLVVDLLNTRVTNREDQLASASAAAAWLSDSSLLPVDAELSEAEWRRLVELREGLDALLLAPGARWNEESARRLRQAIRLAPLEVFVDQERRLAVESSALTFDGVLGRIVSLLVKGYFAGHWQRFKRCANPECLRVFFDDSRNHARAWCGRRCGELIRQRAFRRTEKYRRYR